MIDRDAHPIGWSSMMYELSDAHEHLGELLKEVEGAPSFSDDEFRVRLGHIYAHLNRAWRCRLRPEGLTDLEWEAGREFPDDLQPIA